MEAKYNSVMIIFLIAIHGLCLIHADGDIGVGAYQIRDVADEAHDARTTVSNNGIEAPENRTLVPTENPQNGTDFAYRPGFVGRITQKGFNFASALAIRMMMKQLSQLEIPDMRATFGITDISITDIKMLKFPRPSSRLYPIPWPGYGMRWHAYGINPVITAKYRADVKFAFWTVTKEGTATFTGEDMFFALDFLIGRDLTGHPTTEVLNCISDGDIDLSFRGQWSDMMNVGATLFTKKIRSFITAQMCFQATTEINTRLAEELRRVPLRHIVAKDYVLDLSMIEPPTFQDDAVDVAFKGVVYARDNLEEPPFFPPEIREHANDNIRMIYLYVTDYLINSAFYASFRRGFMSYNITPEMVPEQYRGYMNTTCFEDICLGTLFPQLSWRYPSLTVSVSVKATSPPHISIEGNKFNISLDGEVDVFIQRNGSRHNIFVVTVDISGGFSLEIVDGKLYFNVSFIDPHAEINSSIGEIGSGFWFETMIRLLTQKVIIPKIEEEGANGLKLPKVKDMEFLNPVIVEHGMKNVFVVATDIGVQLRRRRTLVRRRHDVV